MPANIQDYKNPAATSSMIVEYQGAGFFERLIRVILPKPQIYLVKRKHMPYEGMWALPGGFLNCDKESLEEAAVRELKEETYIEAKIEDLELLCVHSEPDRDPRGHVIDHVYIVKNYAGIPKAADDAAELKLFPLNNLPPLAFDHEKALNKYLAWRTYHK